MATIPKIDETFLKEKELDCTVADEGSEIHLVLRNWTFPQAYTPRQADILIVIPAGYPMAGIDMFWTSPDVHLSNGAWPQASEHHEVKADGRNWQRWSRHINWRSGIDSLRSFITAMSLEISKGI